MKNSKKTTSSFKSKYLSLFRFLIRFLCYVIPCFAVMTIGLDFVINAFLIGHSPSPEQYKVLIGAITISAAITGLSFRASKSAKNEEKKRNYFNAAEHLFLATLFFIYTFIVEHSFDFVAFLLPIDAYKNTFFVLLNISEFTLFFFALHRIFEGFILLQSTLPRIDGKTPYALPS
ncbi:MAG: hypothetical protein ABIA97_00240 [Candidatus Omnitrophota bacterium]